MTGKRKILSLSQGKSKKEEVSPKRPKRQIVSKAVDQSTGLSWREETDLKKALYASLQESKKLTRGEDDDDDDDDEVVISPRSRATRRGMTPTGQYSLDESSQDSVRTANSSSTQESNKKTTVHAQRKFAQGQSQPGTPSSTPVKVHTTPVKLFSKRAKTEDFLTFLCLRGSSVLPPHLDFFGFSREESHGGDSSRPNTPGQGVRSDSGETRESTPDLSSSSDSDMRDEVPDLPAMALKNQQTPTRKAARASASTPETARGLASIRTGMAKKTGKEPATALLKRSNTLLASPPKMSPRGKRALLRHQRSPSKSMSKSGSGREPKGNNSKPVRASATPSKKRITPQSLPIGSLPKFYIDDSDSSVQSRGFKEVLLNRRAQSTLKKSKSLKQKLQEIRLKSSTSGKHKVLIVSNSSDKKMKKSRHLKQSFPGKSEIKTKKLLNQKPVRKITRLKEKASISANGRKKRKAAMAKNYAEDEDDLDESIDDLEIVKEVEVTKPVKKKLVVKQKADKGDNRRKIVAASLAKMAATKKLSKIKKSQKKSNQAKLTTDKSIYTKKGFTFKSVKSKTIGAIESTKKTEETSNKTDSPTTTPKRRGRPRSKRFCPSPSEQTQSPQTFPSSLEGGHIVDVPTFYPSNKEFQDPLKYIESIREQAEPFGMCRVVPPASWKPDCKVNDELRFTSQLQYIHKLQNRWGPNVQQMECIRKHLTSVNVDCEQPPLIGGIEVDLPKLHQTIQVFGGAENVAEKKTWIKVADAMKIPKLAQDRATKLYDAYCKYLLSYDTLSYEEKTKLEQQVRSERMKRGKSQSTLNDSVIKGRSTSLGDFSRIARNTVSMWFKDDPSVEQVECEYWKLLQDGQNHVVVQCGHVDTRSQGSAFPVRRDSPCARHGWNFNVLPQNSGSVLKSMGPVTSVTTPTLHIGMLFTTSCWSSDLHLLPYIQYLHTGADTVWYSVPKSEERKFKKALSGIVPDLVAGESIWLPEDTVMVSPELLSQKGVSLGRSVQSQGQFMVVFSHCHTSTISCGYSISESVHYAFSDWIPDGVKGAKKLNEMAEPELFSMEGYLCNLVRETNNLETLSVALPEFKDIVEQETHQLHQLEEDGLKIWKQMSVKTECSSQGSSSIKRRSLDTENKADCICDVCKKICHLYMVSTEAEDNLCLNHAAQHIQKKKNLKGCQLLYRFSEVELSEIITSAEERLAQKQESGNKDKSSSRRRSSNLRSLTTSAS